MRVETAAGRSTLVSADPRWVTVSAGVITRGAVLDAVLIAAPQIELGGRVVDQSGLTIERAAVTVELGGRFAQRFPVPLDASDPRAFTTMTDGARALHAARCPSHPRRPARHCVPRL